MDLSLATIVLWAVPVVFAITLHEAAHGYVAKLFGDQTAWMLGRVTLNPIKHIDPVGTILVPGMLLLSAKLLGGMPFIFGWAKPVPVNFGNLRNPKRDMFWVAGAGPAANFAMAIVWGILLKNTTPDAALPSDGLHAKFPHYCYHDMVNLQYRLLTEKLGVNHLRLVMGTSMGGMHSWLWAEMYPDFMDAAMPLASLPIEISGRNRFFRRMVIDPIRNDPDWQNGEYKTQPVRGLTTALYTLMMMTSSPLQMQKQMPTKAAADAAFDQRIKQSLATTDANDMLYQFDSSRDYNPEPKLESITTHLLAINSADDQVNPPELGVMEKEIKRVKNGRFVLLPITDETRGHGTHTIASIWQKCLAELLAETERKN